jgi:hypothetical protein
VTIRVTSIGANQLTFPTTCGDAQLTQSGDMATQSGSVNCPPTGDGSTESIRDITLLVNGNMLQVDYLGDVSVQSGGTTVSCDGVPVTAMLTRVGRR